MSADAPGTCHQVSCPGKGTVDHHVLGTTIGAPSPEVWLESQKVTVQSHVLITKGTAEQIIDLCERLDRDPGVARLYRVEAAIMRNLLRSKL